MNKKQIGRNIQRIRQVQNITQAELAEMVHLSVSIYRILKQELPCHPYQHF